MMDTAFFPHLGLYTMGLKMFVSTHPLYPEILIKPFALYQKQAGLSF